MKFKNSLLGFAILLISACSDNNISSGTNMNHEFLPVEKAFVFSSQQLDAGSVRLDWKIITCYDAKWQLREIRHSPYHYL